MSMDFFEAKIRIYTIIFLFVIPVGLPILVYFVKKKFLWVSPFVSLALGLLVTAAFYPYYYTDLFDNTIDSTTAYWLYFRVPIHVVVSVIAIAVLYAVKHFRAKR